MAVRANLLPWDEQPQEVCGVNRDLPFASDIAFLWNGSSPTHNLVNGGAATNLGTGTTQTPGVYGVATDFSGSGTSRPTFVVPQAGRATFVVCAQVDSADDFDRLISQYNGTGANRGQYDIYYLNSQSTWVFQAWSSGSQYEWTLNTGLFSGTLVVSADGVGTPRVWLNGASVTPSVRNSGSGVLNVSNNLVAIGGRADVTTRQLDGRIYAASQINAVLSAEWERLLSLNPWLLFEPQRIFGAASGYTHPTLSNARMDPLTAGGGVPRVTYTF